MRTKGSVDLILEDILLRISHVVPYDSACIFLVGDGELRAITSRGLSDRVRFEGQRFPLDNDLTHQLLLSREPIVLADARTNPAFRAWGGAGDTRGWMAIPLVTGNDSSGYLTLDRHDEVEFSPRDADLVQDFANQVAMAIENARLVGDAQALLEQTQRQANQLQQLMDIMPDGVLLLDREQRIVQANGAARAYLGQLADVQVGQKLDQLGSEPIHRLIGTAAVSANWHELTAVEPHGVFEVSAQPLGEPASQGGWLLLIRNVSASRKQEGYLRAQERLSTVGQLAAGIAHDFNNTMAIISLYTQLIMRTREMRETDLQRLRIIEGQAQRASDLIRQILDFSRQSVVEKKPMDLLPFIREAVRSLHQSLPDGIRLETSFEDDEYFTLGDSGRLLQMVNNLAANAAEAMPEGGRLTFALSDVTLRAGEPFPLPDMSVGDWVCLRVIDTGLGVPAEALPRVFEPFYSTKPIGKSTGLGLAQVYGIVKLHDGFIDVDSQESQGTTFTIYLPAFAPHDQEPEPASDDAMYTGSGETILIVEDDTATREALAEYMTVLEYDVLTAANGREALRIFGESGGRVQLVLTDMVMPVMDGATLYARLKLLRANVKMIVITGYPLDASIIDLLEQEAISFIQKPLRVEEVARTVKMALEQSHD